MSREHVIAIDPGKALAEQPETGHNRWHEAVAPVVEVEPGDTVTYETRDAFDGQLHPRSTVADVGGLQLAKRQQPALEARQAQTPVARNGPIPGFEGH